MLCQQQLSRWQRSMETQSVQEINKLANWKFFLLKIKLLNRQLGLFYLNEDSGEDRASCHWYIGQPWYLQNEKIECYRFVMATGDKRQSWQTLPALLTTYLHNVNI